MYQRLMYFIIRSRNITRKRSTVIGVPYFVREFFSEYPGEAEDSGAEFDALW